MLNLMGSHSGVKGVWKASSEAFVLRSMGTCDFKRNCKWHHPDKRERGK